MRVLLLGANGMLARDLAARAPDHIELIACDKRQLDVTDEAGLHRAMTRQPLDVVLNAAAYTNVDGAETAPDRAFAVNARAVGVIGAMASQIDAAVVHYSTDYVFDGEASAAYSESDSPSPLGVYGESKLLGEDRLAESGACYLIVRTQWLFGFGGRSFPRVMLERALQEAPTRVVNDQVGKPTYTVDLADATWAILQSARDLLSFIQAVKQSTGRTNVKGATLHVANRGTATWYELARRIFERCGAPELLAPCTSEEYPTAAQRPKRSVLDTSIYEALSGARLPPWEDAVDRFFAELVASQATGRRRAAHGASPEGEHHVDHPAAS